MNAPTAEEILNLLREISQYLKQARKFVPAETEHRHGR